MISIWECMLYFNNSNNQLTEVFDHDRGTNGTFQLHVEDDRNIFEVTKDIMSNNKNNYRPNFSMSEGIEVFNMKEQKMK